MDIFTTFSHHTTLTLTIYNLFIFVLCPSFSRIYRKITIFFVFIIVDSSYFSICRHITHMLRWAIEKKNDSASERKCYNALHVSLCYFSLFQFSSSPLLPAFHACIAFEILLAIYTDNLCDIFQCFPFFCSRLFHSQSRNPHRIFGFRLR